MATISTVKGREIIDSRGNPTLEVDVILSDGTFGNGAAPSGASTGRHEALELRDNDPSRFKGKGVLKAIENVNEKIFPALKGVDPYYQNKIDSILMELDGTPNKSNLGANTTLAVSLGSSKAAAATKNVPLYQHLNDGREFIIPVPLLNIINGGEHAKNSTDIQEFMAVPAGFKKFRHAIQAGCEVYHSLYSLLASKDLGTTVGDEGGFAPSLGSNKEALELIVDAIEKAGYTPGKEFFIAIDTAATELFNSKDKTYNLKREGKSVKAEKFCSIYDSWVTDYPLISIEDGLSEDEWEEWRNMNIKLGSKVQLVGDDLLTTNVDRIKKAVDLDCANSVLIKPNQIGTVTETQQAMETAHSSGWSNVISHRSGETEDTYIADLAVGMSAGQIKTGAPARGERTAKYNRLIRIEEALAENCRYGGEQVYEKFLH